MRLLTGVAAEEPYGYWCRAYEHVAGRPYPEETRRVDERRLADLGLERAQLLAAMWLYLTEHGAGDVSALARAVQRDLHAEDPQLLVEDELEARATVYALQPVAWAKPGQVSGDIRGALQAYRDTRRSWGADLAQAPLLRAQLSVEVQRWEDHE